ncbi:POTRA domain-containing protein [uncultured Maribacter sp.]|uniref:POTRA domain-containing protein n=1 Tax=uncultured Maribacter sp. TaxID=431308 RepID=UPI0026286AFA|nr:POTRA domain-containing protein [uncultured Maribacter sp.]
MRSSLLLIALMVSFIGFSQEPIIENIEIEGLKRTKESFIRRLIKVKPGSVYDSLKIATDIERLNRLPGVANANSTIIENSATKYSVTYTIVENFTIIPGLRVSQANNGEESAFRVSAFEFNLFGQGQLLGGFYSKDVFNSYGVFWEAPFLFSNKLGVGVNYQSNITFEPIFAENNGVSEDFRYRKQAFQASLLYEHDFHNRAELGFSFGNQEYNLQPDQPNTELPDQIKASTIGIIGEYEFNDLLIEYQYLSGFRNQTNIEYLFNSGASEFIPNAFIGINNLEYFKRVGKKGNFANRLKLSYTTNRDSPFAPFTLDNQINIRGVGNTVDRGTASIVLNTEYRHTLFEKGWFVVQGNTFLDAGTWRNPGNDISQLFDGSSVRVNPGLGLRFIHKRIFNTVIRIDYGFGIANAKTSGLVFGIGQFF